MRTTITADGGIYLFAGLDPGEYKVHIPASQFASGAVLAGWSSTPGQGADNGQDDDSDENGSDAEPVSSGVTSTLITLAIDNEPENFDGESGRESFMDDANDDNTDLTVDFGFCRSVAVGNVIFKDASYNGIFDAGEGVTEPVTLELYESTAVLPFDAPVAIIETGEGGAYLFSGLNPGSYYIRVVQPVSFTNSGGTPSTADDNTDNNNDGAQPGGPGTPLFSPVIQLTQGGESITDGDTDPDTNLTVGTLA